MIRPVHFADQHTLARQTWLRELQEESNQQSLQAMQMLVACCAWGFGLFFAIALGVMAADWVTGEYYAADIVASWRGRT